MCFTYSSMNEITIINLIIMTQILLKIIYNKNHHLIKNYQMNNINNNYFKLLIINEIYKLLIKILNIICL